jgi:hypothetical protein
MSAADLASFTQDDVSEYVNEFADPYADVKVSRVTETGLDFIVIQVAEFAEIPVVCKKNGPAQWLRRGALHTRAFRKNESVEVPSQTEMREILEAAIEKGFRKLLAQLRRAGVSIVESTMEKGEEELESTSRKFDQQLGGP